MVQVQRFWRGLFLLTLLAVVLLAGCGQEKVPTELPPQEERILWILTERTASCGMNSQAESVARAFEADHPGVRVNLETLPESGQERENRLEQLRTQVMAGDGPDGYLLSANLNYGSDYGFLVPQQGMRQALFPDVEMAMYSGLFADLSPYYDADTELHTEALQQTVMEAGVVDGARYVLPLRYEIPVVYLDAEQLAASGLDREKMASSLYGFWKEVLEEGGPQWTSAARYYRGAQHMQFLPPLFDYEAGEVILPREALRTYLEAYQWAYAKAGGTAVVDVLNLDDYWSTKSFLSEEHPAEIATLDMALTTAAIAKSEQKKIEMLPLSGGEGELVARITYYAAAGAGSEKPELTYAFLREFLREENQWQEKRKISGVVKNQLLIESGWPVRNVGSAAPLWNYVKELKTMDIRSEPTERRTHWNRLIRVELEDGDIPALSVPVQRAYFENDGLQERLSAYLRKLNRGENREAPADVDLDQVAEDILAELEQYLAEG